MEEEGIDFYDTELEDLNEEDIQVPKEENLKKNLKENNSKNNSEKDSKKDSKTDSKTDSKKYSKISKDEFLIHIFKTLIIGGRYNQYDNFIDKYREMSKFLYKSTVEYFK